MCFYNVKAQCLIPYILLFSKPQPQTTTTGSSTAPPPWSNLYIYVHTELDEHHTIVCKSLPAVWISLLQRSCKPSIGSSVTPPCFKKYIPGQDPAVLCACVFFKLNCWVTFGRQSPEDVVVKPLLLALHDKDNSFFVKSGTCTENVVFFKNTFKKRNYKDIVHLFLLKMFLFKHRFLY